MHKIIEKMVIATIVLALVVMGYLLIAKGVEVERGRAVLIDTSKYTIKGYHDTYYVDNFVVEDGMIKFKSKRDDLEVVIPANDRALIIKEIKN